MGSSTTKRVVVLGAGFAGLELTTCLSEEFGDELEIVLIDRNDAFIFGFSKLDLMFGRRVHEEVRHPYAHIAKPGARFVQTAIQVIDPASRTVQTEAGSFEADILVVALGADLEPEATPGLAEGGHQFYTVPGALATHDALERFEGGRVVIGVLSAPFKCPPAPSEAALLLHDHLLERGLRDKSEIALVMDFGLPVPPSPDASEVLLRAFAERAIEWHAKREVHELDAARGVALLRDGGEMPYDLFLAVPVHRAPSVVVAAGLTVDGWIPVDPLTFETAYEGVYAVGDVAAVGTPRAGAFAEGHAAVAAQHIAAAIRGTTSAAQYGGRGICYVEFGAEGIAMVDATVLGDRVTGRFVRPSQALSADKTEFASSRIRRWFDPTSGASSRPATVKR